MGGGPKGMFALERLLDHAAKSDSAAKIEIDLFEPHAVPGAGPVYDPGQPEYLKMNFAADQLNMWWPDGGTVPADQRLPFVTWRARAAEHLLAERYPPRAEVGRYLASGYEALLRHAPSSVKTVLHRSAVHDIRLEDFGWLIETRDAARERLTRYDEILLATGHDQASAGRLETSWSHAAALVPGVFPVERCLARERVPPGAVVTVRGFALTFLDAALALTEGRGGSFEALPHPYRLRYTAADGQVRLILPFSRRGRPMLAKPDPELIGQVAALEHVAEDGNRQILRLIDDFDVMGDLLPVVASVAASSLLHMTGKRSVGEPLRELSRRICASLINTVAGISPGVRPGAADEIERSLAVGCGASAPNQAWALGHSWRALYPALVTRLSGHGLSAGGWRAFHRLANEMERFAFGPPPLNAAKLLALVDAGIVDLSYLDRARIVTRQQVTSIRCDRGAHAVDVVVDAVLPGPGLRGDSNSLLGRLVADGYARVLAGARGLEVRFDGSCLGADGAITPGLAVVGRATEDSVIGNDTLNRSLHPLADHWARRIVQRAEDDAGAGARVASREAA